MTQFRPVAATYPRKADVLNALTAGKKRVRFAELETGIHGRPGHIMGILIKASVPWSSDATVMPSALPGALLPGVIQNIRLKVGTHDYIRDMDGYEIELLSRFRKTRAHSVLADIADATTTGSVDLVLYIPTSRPSAPGSMQYDFALPLSMFSGDRNAQNGLEFEIGSARGFPGVTFGNPTSLEVFADIAPLDDLKISGWQWFGRDIAETYLDEEVQSGPIETLLFTSVVEATGVRDVSSVVSTLKVGQQQVFGSFTAGDLNAGLELRRVGEPNAVPSMGQAGSEEWLPLIAESPTSHRSKWFRGRVRAELSGTLPASGARRWVFATGGVMTEETFATLAKAAGAPMIGDTPDVISRAASAGKDISELGASLMDQRIYWRGMPWEIPNAKALELGA